MNAIAFLRVRSWIRKPHYPLVSFLNLCQRKRKHPAHVFVLKDTVLWFSKSENSETTTANQVERSFISNDRLKRHENHQTLNYRKLPLLQSFSSGGRLFWDKVYVTPTIRLKWVIFNEESNLTHIKFHQNI